ncbi:MAG: hypothetical protein DMG13_18815 [Acidobacteria bacterium]|nr:MAG: hypothetical protein DMG13_18815 [Acidobacteriota bacterium]
MRLQSEGESVRYRSILVPLYILLLASGGCFWHQPQLQHGRNPYGPVSPGSLSDYLRTVMKISPQNAMATDEQAQSIHQRRPELAELAARVAEGKSDLEERRRLADAYLRERLYSHAFNLYQQIQSEAPDDAGVQLALALIFDNWSDYQVAIQHAKTTVRLEPTSAQGWDVLGRIHLHAGELDSAQSAWTTALQINGEDASVLANAGYVFLLESNWQQARVFLEGALERDGSLPDARNNLGIVLSKLGDDQGALQQFMALNRPAVAYNNLGVVQLDEGLRVEAANAFKQALTYEPDYLIAQDNLTEVQAYLPHPAIVGLPPFDVSAAPSQSATPNAEPEVPSGAAVPPNPAQQTVVLGITELDTSLNTRLSIPAVATEMQLANPAALPTSDDLFAERGVPPLEIPAPVLQGALDADVYAEASEQLNRPVVAGQIGGVVSETPKPELAARVAEGKSDLGKRRRLADAYLRERLYSLAYHLYRQIQSESPDDAGVQLALALIFDNWSDYQVAIQHAKTAVRLEPTSAQGWDVLGRIHLHAGELDSAQSAWTTALQINGEDASVLANAGHVFLLERNRQQARVFLERALERDGLLPEARNNPGIVLSKLGDDQGALQQFMALNRPPVAYDNLGVVQLDEGLRVEAANAFRQALTYEPDYLIAQDNLTEVQAYLPHPAIVGMPPFDVSAAQSQSATQAEAEAPSGATVPPSPAQQTVVLGSTELDTSLSTRLSIPAVAAAQIGDVFSRTTQPQPQEARALRALEPGHLSVVFCWALAILGMARAISRKSVQKIAGLGDLRPGSTTTTQGKCGKATCHCAEADHPGHGPHRRLTYKAEGRTRTQSLPSTKERQKAEAEVAEFRRFQQLCRDYVEVNTAIRQQRSVESVGLEEKKRLKPSKRKSAKR